MNMFKPTGAKSTEEYIAMLPEDRRSIIEDLDGLIKKTVPKLKPHFAYNMLGYGEFPYVSYKKEPGTWPIIALASQKNYISLYVCAVEGGEYLAEKYKAELGKVSVGRSCIRFKKLEDLNKDVLVEVLKKAEQMPGLIAAGEHK